ncbi:MAG: hypothetical protein ACJAQX_001787 [Polaribacter sp.]|jgi:hypothetical protein
MTLKPRQIRRYLKEPYPYYYSNQKRLIVLLLFISALSFSFSYFFEPFSVNAAEHKINSLWILLIHAFMPFPIAYLYLSFINRHLKSDVNWTLGKELLNLSILLLLIGIASFLIRDLVYTNPDNWSLRYFWEEICNTFLIGFLLLIIVLPINLERLIYKHTSSLKKFPMNPTKEFNGTFVSIKTSIPNEDFKLHIKEFLFAKVESNYIEVFTSSSQGIDKTLIRMTLKELEDQLHAFPYIFKTHRSYLVNLHAITATSGNAQGYQLTLKKNSDTIPVSRSNIAEFSSLFAAL